MGTHRVVVNLEAAEPGAGAELYRNVLGLEPVMDLGWITTFASPKDPLVQLSVLTADATAPVNPAASVEVDDVDSAFAAALEHGCEIVYPLTNETWGVRRFFFRDPSTGAVLNVVAHH